MSDHQNENATRIAAYLENRLSPEEREAFKRRLGEDDELRLQYVSALMNRAGGSGEVEREPESEVMPVPEVLQEPEVTPEPEPVVVWEPEPAVVWEPDPVATYELEPVAPPEPLVKEVSAAEVGEPLEPEDWEADWPGERKRARAGFLGSGWIVAITLLLLIIAGVVMFIISRRQDLWDKTVAAMATDSGAAKKGTRVDSAAAATPPAATTAAPVNSAGKGGGMGTTGDSLFATLYKPYARGDDPRELQQYYADYRKENFAAVVAKGDSPALGTGQRAVVIRDYMRLYVGLSALATGDAPNAAIELEAVVRRTKPGDILYETAKWYLALAWLKRKDVDPVEARSKATELARDISRGYSRYREPARRLVHALGS
jgi:hypothetical protein